MPVDVQQLFDTTLPEAFTRNPDQVKSFDVIYQMNITGDGGGQWQVDASPTGPKVIQGSPGGEQAGITMTAQDFQTFHDDPNAAMPLYFAGKMQVTGDPMQAMKLQKLLDMTRG
ncbi:SCP2 sterol-binding domain-containing protein [Streptomyces sp. NPDC126497]|uniref:SCP2 sterol-binding domain-containing protein n=1 Tax=Streptomyces sp. NPDC126497 TaxID=3155313 RepID=UPI00332F574E